MCAKTPIDQLKPIINHRFLKYISNKSYISLYYSFIVICTFFFTCHKKNDKFLPDFQPRTNKPPPPNHK